MNFFRPLAIGSSALGQLSTASMQPVTDYLVAASSNAPCPIEGMDSGCISCEALGDDIGFARELRGKWRTGSNGGTNQTDGKGTRRHHGFIFFMCLYSFPSFLL